MSPKVSVCIPAYKQPDYMRLLLQSLVIQDYDDYEVVITDDTPDDSIKNIVSATVFNAALTYVKNPKHLGVPGNWNHAVSLARGEYVKMLHNDDRLLFPYSLKRFVALMDENPAVAIGFSSAEAFDGFQQHKFTHVPSSCDIDKLRKDRNILFFGNILGPPSSVIFRSSTGIRFDSKLKWLVDVDFYLRLMEGGKPFAFEKEPLVGVTVDSDHQLTRECENNKSVELYEYLYLYAKLSDKWSRLPLYLKFFSRLFKKYSVTSSAELSGFAQDVALPAHLKLLLLLQR